VVANIIWWALLAVEKAAEFILAFIRKSQDIWTGWHIGLKKNLYNNKKDYPGLQHPINSHIASASSLLLLES
jgi:hypothetical protein